MELYEMLKEDHREVTDLLARIEPAHSDQRKALFLEMKDKVMLHILVEEKYLYPALEHQGVSRDITLESYEEHRLVEILLNELDDMDEDDDEWAAKLKVLRENLEHHITEEEGEMFPRAQSVLTPEQAEQIAENIATEKAEQMALKP